MSTDTIRPKPHLGRNIKRLREILNVKQEVLANDINMSQQFVSDLEQREEIEESMLKMIAQALNIPVEAIKNFSDEATYNYINTFNDKVESSFLNNPINCTFNPIEKIMELYHEKEQLYQKLLEAEKEKIEFLKKLLDR